MNVMVTISFISLGVKDDDAGPIFKRLTDSIGRWWRYQRSNKARDIGPPTAIHAHANPNGSRHVHWLMHLPDKIRSDFEGAITKRLRKLTLLDDLGDALHIQPVETPGSAAKYILRGIDPAYGAYLHILPEPEGTVSCRRTGTTRAIGRAARRHSGWKRKASPRASLISPDTRGEPQSHVSAVALTLEHNHGSSQ